MPPPQDYGSGNRDSENPGSADLGSPARFARPRTSRRVWTPAPGQGRSCSPCVRPLPSDRQSMFPCTSLSPLARIPTIRTVLLGPSLGTRFILGRARLSVVPLTPPTCCLRHG